MGQALKKKAHLPIAEVATYSQDSQSSRGMETDWPTFIQYHELASSYHSSSERQYLPLSDG